MSTSPFDPELEAFKSTWPAFEVDNPERVNTELIRSGYRKPTIWLEHQVIHMLCSALDQTRAQLAEAKAALAEERKDNND